MTNIAKNFDQIIHKIANNLKRHGVEKKIEAIERSFQSFPVARQAQIIQRSSLQLEQMELLEPSLSERDYISTLCLFHRLKPIDETVYEKFSSEIFWEILDFNFNQIYRNKLVYKYTNYCISELEEHTPFELYDRPRRVVEQLMEVVEQLKTSTTIVDMSQIKPYILKECKSMENGLLQIQHEFACPLVDIETGERKAFVAGLRPTPLKLDKENTNILLMN